MMSFIALYNEAKIRNFEWPVSKKMSKNPNFWHLILVNPGIKIFFSKFRPRHFFYLIDP